MEGKKIEALMYRCLQMHTTTCKVNRQTWPDYMVVCTT